LFDGVCAASAAHIAQHRAALLANNRGFLMPCSPQHRERKIVDALIINADTALDKPVQRGFYGDSFSVQYSDFSFA
jgi:hypothetical protein